MNIDQMKEHCLLYYRVVGMGPPQIYTTAEYSDPDEPLICQDSVTIKASVPGLAILCIFGGNLIALFVSLPLYVAHYKLPHWLLWTGGSVVLACIFMIGSNKIFKPIILDKKGIVFRGRSLAWSDVLQTFIVDFNPMRRRTSKSVAIMDRFQNVYKFGFPFLEINAKQLSALIEYFKTNKD
jgi:hypothetical protein